MCVRVCVRVCMYIHIYLGAGQPAKIMCGDRQRTPHPHIRFAVRKVFNTVLGNEQRCAVVLHFPMTPFPCFGSLPQQ